MDAAGDGDLSSVSQITFVAYGTPEPQGSIRSVPTKRGPRLTSTNKDLKVFRHMVCQIARMKMSETNQAEPMAGKHVPVEMVLEFTFVKPPSVSKRRLWPTVKPDIDKLERAILDSVKGVLYVDDGQVVRVVKEKRYGPVEQVHISARVIEEKP